MLRVSEEDDDGNETTAMTDWDLRPSCCMRRGYTETDEQRLTEYAFGSSYYVDSVNICVLPQARNSTIDADEYILLLYAQQLWW